MTSERVKKTFYHQGLSPLMRTYVTSVSGHLLLTVQGLLAFPATPLRIMGHGCSRVPLALPEWAFSSVWPSGIMTLECRVCRACSCFLFSMSPDQV